MSELVPSEGLDTVEESKKFDGRRAFDLLMEAQGYWSNMDRFRRDRERNKNYTYGEQWGDLIINENGKTMTEEQYIMEQGQVPLTNNLIRRLVRNVIGVYRSQAKEPTCTARDIAEKKLGEIMSTVLQYNMQLNKASELNARSFEEFLIGGGIIYKCWSGWRQDKMECWTDYVQPNNFFIDNHMKDFRGWDVSFLGEVHDVSFLKVCQKFAKSPADQARLSEIYSYAKNRNILTAYGEQFGYSRLENIDFLVPSDPTLCRVVEIWRKELKPRYRYWDPLEGNWYKCDINDYVELVQRVNEQRLAKGRADGIPDEEIPLIRAEWFEDEYWHYYFLSPFGDILDEGETPYWHKSHPYVFRFYPYIDSEVHSFVSDVIDQQRYTNQLITMYNWILKASAKGVLLFPEDAIPEGYDINDIADEWSRFNGVIVVRKRKDNSVMPQQIANNSTNIGITELLNLQLKFFEDISGVNGALQGKPGYSTVSGKLYEQQTQNATTSLLDILDTFSSFIVDVAYKTVKNIQQFYDSKRVFNISGRADAQVVYDPAKIRNVEFDLSIVESTATAAYRQAANDALWEMWGKGAIDTKLFLQHSDFPWADDLLQSIQSQEEQARNGETPQGFDPALLQQVQGSANMENVNKAYNMLTRQHMQAAS